MTRLWLTVLSVFFITGCSASRDYLKDINFPVTDGSQAMVLGPGDIFAVQVYREHDLSGEFQVSKDGTIDYPLLGILHVGGKSASEVSEMIRKGLAKRYLRHAYVSVLIKKYRSKRVYVLGEVRHPGTLPFQERMTIVQAIAQAGGFKRTARTDDVIVTRMTPKGEKKVVVPVESISEGKAPNFFLVPGDIVFVPESLL